MEVINIHEKEDGGAEIEFDLTAEEVQFLLSYAIKDILLKTAKEVEEGDRPIK